MYDTAVAAGLINYIFRGDFIISETQASNEVYTKMPKNPNI